ncbi:MAG: hypothetical protein K2N09_06745 [Muribaculaceae bacterium]|nr:hypothetical protein [Muribaculaceae bacterium]
MKITITYFILSLSLLLLTGCGDAGGNMARLQTERDSLITVNERQKERLNNYDQAVILLNSTLDSIAQEEKMIFVNAGNVEGPITKDIVRLNLERFESILNHQKERINQLELKIKARNDSSDKSLSLIAHLQDQIKLKDTQILQLRKEIEKKNVDITRLQEQVESQQYTIDSQTVKIDELNKRTQRQNEALARQDAILNNGYVLLGTKADLQRKGILKKGKLVSESMLDRSKFKQVDMRHWKEVTFTAKKPRILSNMPVSSYQLTTDGQGSFTLNIINPSDFWKITSYLIIQTE